MKIQKFLGLFVEINVVNNEDVTVVVRNSNGQPLEVFYTLETLIEWINSIPHLASKEQDK